MVAENFVSWVKVNVPQIYDKNLSYTTNEEVYTLLLALKNYHDRLQNKYADKFNDIAHFNSMKNTAYTNYNNIFNALNPQADNFEAQVNAITNSGQVQACVEAFNSLSELVTNFFI